MNFNTPVLELDLTGNNIDNRVIDEPHSLSVRPTRSIATNKGPFYAASLSVRDGGVVLSRGIDYQLVELHQEATLKTGKEIHSVILIINKNVSSDVTVTYQAVGGHFGRNDEAIANLYQSLLTDDRPVPWEGLMNKPTEFNPTVHRHLLDDVYGFEPVVDYLERIKRAITLGQTSVVLEIVNALLSKFRCKELPKVLPSNKLLQYDAMLFFLSRRKILNNIWIDTVGCNWTKGQTAAFEIDTSGYPVGSALYWQFYRQDDETVTLFTDKEGYITTNGGIVTVHIYIPSDLNNYDTNMYLGVKEQKSDEDFKAVSYVITIKEPVTTNSAYGYMAMNQVDGSDFERLVGNYATNPELRLWYMLNHY